MQPHQRIKLPLYFRERVCEPVRVNEKVGHMNMLNTNCQSISYWFTKPT